MIRGVVVNVLSMISSSSVMSGMMQASILLPEVWFLSFINGVYRALKRVKYYIQVVQNILCA